MSTTVKSTSKKSKLTNTDASKKLARNLHEQFDDYTLHEQYSFEERSNQTPAKLLDSSIQKSNKENTSVQSVARFTKTNAELEKDKKYEIPKSYLLAMQHLQDTVDEKDQEIEELKAELLQKQKYIYECESRVNQALKKCQELSQNQSRKQMEIDILKTQNEELRVDKDSAIKQVAKAMEI